MRLTVVGVLICRALRMNASILFEGWVLACNFVDIRCSVVFVGTDIMKHAKVALQRMMMNVCV